MLRAQFFSRTLSGFATLRDPRRNADCSLISISNSPSSCSFQCSIQFAFKSMRCRCPKSILVSCKSSPGSVPGGRSGNDPHENDHDYLEASLLISETLTHYRMLRQGFQEDMRWQSSGKSFPFAVQAKESGLDMSSMGHGFLRRFQNPTIFLKVSCDGDLLLPIIVGESAVEKLVDTLWGDDSGVCPEQYQLVKNVVERLGFKVMMVRITERVVSTYFARLYFGKPGENNILSLDVQPSDAINLARRCEAPIYVSKQIVFMDAIRIGYGVGGVCAKSTFDVSLDSVDDGPDSVAEELDLLRNMNLAVKEERYNDAAMWRDKLMELRKSSHEH